MKRKPAAKPARKPYTRVTTTVRGKGDYSYTAPGPWGRWGRRIGSALGRAAGSQVGEAGLGAALGAKLGGLAHYVGKIFGSGDYTFGSQPVYNSLWKGALSSNTQMSFGDGKVRIRHRDSLGDVISSATPGAFQCINYSVSPTLANTFPWLAQIAPSFQCWKAHGIVFEFKSTSGEAIGSTNTALGSVIIAADMNPATFSQNFANKQDMLNYVGACSCKPSQSMVVGIECDSKRLPGDGTFFTRTFSNLVGASLQDVRFSDLCSVGVATTGIQAASINLGELYVIYDIELSLSQDYIPGQLSLYARGTLQTSSLANQVGGTTTSGLLGANSSLVISSANLLVDNYNDTVLSRAYITIPDRAILQTGMAFEFSYTVLNSAVTLVCGAPTPQTVAGTFVEATSMSRFLNPAIVTSSNQISFCYTTQITNLNLLQIPTGGKYTPALGYPNAAVLFAIQNTTIAGASNTMVLPVGTITGTQWSIDLVNPLDLGA